MCDKNIRAVLEAYDVLAAELHALHNVIAEKDSEISRGIYINTVGDYTSFYLDNMLRMLNAGSLQPFREEYNPS